MDYDSGSDEENIHAYACIVYGCGNKQVALVNRVEIM